MPNLISIQPIDDRYASITWQVNNFCNYRCSYCNEGNWSGKYRNNDDIENVISNVKKLIDFYESQNYINFKFFFSGGEPTLWKGLIPVVDYLKTRLGKHVTLAINTNLSRKLSWWKEHYHYIDDVVASYHPEFANKENYFEVAEFLQDKINYLCLRMMMVEERFEEMVNLGNEVKTRFKNYNLEWVPLLEEMSTGAVPWTYKDPRITKFLSENNFESKITINKPNLQINISSEELYDDNSRKVLNSNRLVAENRNFFKGWSCHVHEAIFISPSGKMSAASCGQGPELGNIFNEFVLPTNSIICKKDYCHCGTDITITKHI